LISGVARGHVEPRHSRLGWVVPREGFEPPTLCLEGSKKLLVRGQAERRGKRLSGGAYKVQKQVLQEEATTESQQDQEG
jgi:hypothetical protein